MTSASRALGDRRESEHDLVPLPLLWCGVAVSVSAAIFGANAQIAASGIMTGETHSGTSAYLLMAVVAIALQVTAIFLGKASARARKLGLKNTSRWLVALVVCAGAFNAWIVHRAFLATGIEDAAIIWLGSLVITLFDAALYVVDEVFHSEISARKERREDEILEREREERRARENVVRLDDERSRREAEAAPPSAVRLATAIGLTAGVAAGAFWAAPADANPALTLHLAETRSADIAALDAVDKTVIARALLASGCSIRSVSSVTGLNYHRVRALNAAMTEQAQDDGEGAQDQGEALYDTAAVAEFSDVPLEEQKLLAEA